MRQRVCIASFAGLLALSAFPTLVSAHDPPDALNVVSDGDRTLVSTSRGLVVGSMTDGGWSFLCREAVGLGIGEVPGLELNRAGDVLMTTSGGLAMGPLDGCGFAPVEPFVDVGIGHLSPIPGADDGFYVATSQVDESNGLFRSDDGGLTWGVVGTLEPEVFYSRVAVSPSDPQTLHLGGVRIDLDAGRAIYFVRTSSDGWESYEEREIPIDPEIDFRALVLGVHDETPERVYARVETFTSAMAPDRLVAWGGSEWETVLEAHDISGFASTPEGYIVTTADGIFRSGDGEVFELADGETTRALCVRETGAGIVVCGDDLAPFALADWSSSTGSAGIFRFTDVRDTTCPSFEELCAENWDDWVTDLFPDGIPDGSGDFPDVGVDSGGGADAGGSPGGSGGGGGCSAGGTQSRSAGWLLLAFAAAIGVGGFRPRG